MKSNVSICLAVNGPIPILSMLRPDRRHLDPRQRLAQPLQVHRHQRVHQLLLVPLLQRPHRAPRLAQLRQDVLQRPLRLIGDPRLGRHAAPARLASRSTMTAPRSELPTPRSTPSRSPPPRCPRTLPRSPCPRRSRSPPSTTSASPPEADQDTSAGTARTPFPRCP